MSRIMPIAEANLGKHYSHVGSVFISAYLEDTTFKLHINDSKCSEPTWETCSNMKELLIKYKDTVTKKTDSLFSSHLKEG